MADTVQITNNVRQETELNKIPKCQNNNLTTILNPEINKLQPTTQRLSYIQIKDT
jgi:hypothetical protein